MKKISSFFVILALPLLFAATLPAQTVQRPARTIAPAVTVPGAETKNDANKDQKAETKTDAGQEPKSEAKAEPGVPGTAAPQPAPPAVANVAPQPAAPAGAAANPNDTFKPEVKAAPAQEVTREPKQQAKPEKKAERKRQAKAEPAEDDEDDEEEGSAEECSVLAIEAKFDQVLKEAGPGSAFAEFFARDAVVVSSAIVEGRPWASGLESGVTVTFKPFSVKVSSSCDYGFVVGDWEEARNGKVLWGGQYVNVWKKVKNQWKICAHGKNMVPRGYKAEKRPALAEVVSKYEKKGRSAGPVSDAEKNFFGTLKRGGWAKVYDALADNDIIKIRQNGPTLRGKKQVFLTSVVEKGFLEGKVVRSRTSRNGDMAVVWGGAEAKGPQPYQTGSFLHVWTRDGEGEWKLGVDFLMLGGNDFKKSLL